MRRIATAIFLAMGLLTAAIGLRAESRVKLPLALYHHQQLPSIGKGELAAPAVAGHEAFVATSTGHITAIDLNSWATTWQVLLESPVESQPLVVDDRIYLGLTGGEVVCLDRADGAEVWRQSVQGRNSGGPTRAGDTILVTNSENRLIALDAATGRWKWDYDRGKIFAETEVQGMAAPIMADQTAVTGFADGMLVGVSLDGGDLIWEQNLNARGRFRDVDWILLDDYRLIAPIFDRSLAAIDVRSGKRIWQIKDLFSATGAPAEWRGQIAQSTLKPSLALIDGGTGALVHEYALAHQPIDPLIIEQYALYTTREGYIEVIDLTEPQLYRPWRMHLTGEFSTPLVDTGTLLLALSDGGYLYALRFQNY